MATKTVTLPSLTVPDFAPSRGNISPQRSNQVRLKAENGVFSLRQRATTGQRFAKAANPWKAGGNGRRGSGALDIKCSAAAEIFKIAAIMNGLTLVGVAVGFALLRLEAYIEESED